MALTLAVLGEVAVWPFCGLEILMCRCKAIINCISTQRCVTHVHRWPVEDSLDSTVNREGSCGTGVGIS